MMQLETPDFNLSWDVNFFSFGNTETFTSSSLLKIFSFSNLITVEVTDRRSNHKYKKKHIKKTQKHPYST